jgi:SAM-dependent methyltransferase
MNYLRRNIKDLFKLFISKPFDFFWFASCLKEWEASAKNPWKAMSSKLNICTYDRGEAAGQAKGHYFLQDLWAAQHVYKFAPNSHVDIGSSVQGFVAHVASFAPIEYVDIRPLDARVPNLSFRKGSILELPYKDCSVHSISCLHVIEHIGLGRYGDPINPEGWILGLKELQRVLAPGGQLLLSTPCGIPCVHFNAHRIFKPTYIIDHLNLLKLEEFSLIEDDHSTDWISNCEFSFSDSLTFGCGLFRFTKL